MIILGIDPGYATVGYGIIHSERGRQRALKYGVITTPKTDRFPARLRFIAESIDSLIKEFKPNAIAVEELFFQSNQKTAMFVAEARGVCLLVAEMSSARLYEYTPLQVKQALTGYGRADKGQIQHMVTVFLGLKSIPKPDDAADALAVAITHAQTNTTMANFEI